MPIKPNPRVFREYPLHVKDIYQVQEGVYRLETDRGPMCLKRSDRNVEKVIFIYSVLTHLITAGFTKVSPPVTAKNGAPFVEDGGEIYFMTQWLSGVPCDFRNSHHLSAAVKTLAEFHGAARGLSVLPGGKARVMYQRWPATMEKRMNDLKKFRSLAGEKNRKNDFEKLFLRAADEAVAHGEEACRLLAVSPYGQLAEEAEKAGTFVHRDVADRNFIIGRDKIAYLIDFDYCRYDLILTDLVRLVERTLKDVAWNGGRADFIFQAYQKAAPLRPEDFQVMQAFFRFPQKIWRVADRYFSGKQDWQEEGHTKKLKLALKNREVKEEFIKYFEKNYCRC